MVTATATATASPASVAWWRRAPRYSPHDPTTARFALFMRPLSGGSASRDPACWARDPMGSPHRVRIRSSLVHAALLRRVWPATGGRLLATFQTASRKARHLVAPLMVRPASAPDACGFGPTA